MLLLVVDFDDVAVDVAVVDVGTVAFGLFVAIVLVRTPTQGTQGNEDRARGKIITSLGTH